MRESGLEVLGIAGDDCAHGRLDVDVCRYYGTSVLSPSGFTQSQDEGRIVVSRKSRRVGCEVLLQKNVERAKPAETLFYSSDGDW